VIIFVNSAQKVNEESLSEAERRIYLLKQKSPLDYVYHSANDLRFELQFRTRMIENSRELARSGAGFASFRRSRCNPDYWDRTRAGGFQVRGDRAVSDAIRDIFRHGDRYAFECATAIAIVMYKSVLDCIAESSFNELFRGLLLYDWHLDSDLRLITVNDASEAYPGDVQYFKNPDVSFLTPWWQGENVVKLGENLYYGHGVGILPSEGIIAKLNSHRKIGAKRSAYMLNQTSYPDFAYLAYFATRGKGGAYRIEPPFRNRALIARIGHMATISLRK